MEAHVGAGGWMGGLGDLTLRTLLLPGTHDSGACPGLRGWAADAPKHLRQRERIADLLEEEEEEEQEEEAVGGVGGVVHGIGVRWAVAQERSEEQQVRDGIRFLDLRVCRHEGRFRLCHGLLGRRVEAVLQGVRRAMEETRDVLVVCMSHFYNMDRAHHAELLRRATAVLGDVLVPRSCMREAGLPACHLPLREAWRRGWRVVLVYKKKADLVKAHPAVWYGNMLRSPWPNTTSSRVLKLRLEERMRAGLPCDVLHVLQAVLTPRPLTVLLGLVRASSSSLLQLADKATPQVVEWLQEEQWRQWPINAVIVDHYHRTAFLQVVIAENYRRQARIRAEQAASE